MHVQTKIICTIGPAVNTVERMIDLMDAGMNVARVNFSHGDHEQHKVTISNLKKARKQADRPLAIMLDTKGPEIRVGILKKDKIELREKQRVNLVAVAKNDNDIPVNPFSVFETVHPGMRILFDDGYIISEVVEKKEDRVVIEIKNDGFLKSQKGINIPDAYLNLPAMTEKDISDIKFGCKLGIDLIAASFTRSADHVLQMKQLLEQENHLDVKIIAKIENKEGVENFNHIVQVADGIMVARGDLGVEVDISLVPYLQKMMIRKSNERYKPVVTATQMLESMINNPRPTRAEASDVANAIYDGTSLVMLSGETAIGKYPIETVRQMKSIVKGAEEHFEYVNYLAKQMAEECNYHNISNSVAIAAVEATYNCNGKAIFVISSSGFTARLIAHLRPRVPIIALTMHEKVYHQLSFIWGVIPLYAPKCESTHAALDILKKFAVDHNIVSFGDLVVLTAGAPFGKKGSTNMLRVESIGSILVRGYQGIGEATEGEVIIVFSAKNSKPQKVTGKILVISSCNKNYVSMFKQAKAVILQNTTGDDTSEQHALELAKTFNIPVLVRADNAMTLLSDGQHVVVDPQKALIYSNESK